MVEALEVRESFRSTDNAIGDLVMGFIFHLSQSFSPLLSCHPLAALLIFVSLQFTSLYSEVLSDLAPTADLRIHKLQDWDDHPVISQAL